MNHASDMIAVFDVCDAETEEIVAADIPAAELPHWVPQDRTRSYRIRAKGIGAWGSVRTFPAPTMDQTDVRMDDAQDAPPQVPR